MTPGGPFTLPAHLAARVKKEARRLGIALDDLELLVQEPKIARAFLRAVRAGRAQAFLQSLDTVALERRLAENELGIGIPQAPGVRGLG